MTTAQACVRGLLVAARLPWTPRWGRSGARFSPRFAARLPARTAGAMQFADSPQRWGVAPHGEHPVVEVPIHLLSPRLPALRTECVSVSDFGRTCRSSLHNLGGLQQHVLRN